MQIFPKNKQSDTLNLEGLDFERYKREGVDIGLILYNLKRSPTERLETNLVMLDFIEEARKAREKLDHASP